MDDLDIRNELYEQNIKGRIAYAILSNKTNYELEVAFPSPLNTHNEAWAFTKLTKAMDNVVRWLRSLDYDVRTSSIESERTSYYVEYSNAPIFTRTTWPDIVFTINLQTN